MSRRYTPKRGRITGRAGTRVSSRVMKQARVGRHTGWRSGYDRTGGYYGTQRNQARRMKFHDVDIDDAAVAVGVTVTDSVNKIGQGVTENTRVGQACMIKKIGWHFDIFIPESTSYSNTSDIVRVIMYVDKQCNGATAASTDVLETADYQAFNNLANKGRFRTLMDRTYSISTTAGAGHTATAYFGRHAIHDSFHKKVSIPLNFDATTGAITEIRSNNIGVMICSRNGLCGFTSKVRLRFMDNDA